MKTPISATLLVAMTICPLAILKAAPARGQTNASAPVVVYPPDYFAKFQPYSAYDLVGLLPGFKLESGDAEIRGFAGASGNVLIDGQRPVTKQETLEDLLRRIPVTSIDHIELIRPGAPGIDMQGRSVLANIVRKKEASTRLRLEAGTAFFFDHRLLAPRVAAEFSRRSGDRLIEATASYGREIDDEHGYGTRHRLALDGPPIRLAGYDQAEGETVAEATVNYEDRLFGGKLKANALLRRTAMFADIANRISFPAIDEEAGTERERTIDGEAGLNFTRSIGTRSQLELLALRRMSYERSTDTQTSGADSEIATDRDDGTETVLRAVVRRSGGLLTLEAGIEGAINTLDSRRRLLENGVSMHLPAANVRVEEKRAEPFVTTTWRLAGNLSLEAGAKAEVSRLSQSGDTALTKSFFYPKPRLLASWAPSANDQFRLLAEREVGQLTFSNFVGAASLSTGVITAGNPDLEPDSIIRYSFSWERHFWNSGSIVLTARRENVSDVVDRVPVTGNGITFDAVGNIGSGRRTEGEADLILPFDRMGLRGVLLKANLLVRKSEVTDPATGARRRISGDAPVEGEVHLSYEAPRIKTRFGVDVDLPVEEARYKFNELQIDRLGTRVGIFVEYKPSVAWNLRLYAKNLTDSPATRERSVAPALRGTVPFGYVETRRLRSGRYIGFTLQRTFG